MSLLVVIMKIICVVVFTKLLLNTRMSDTLLMIMICVIKLATMMLVNDTLLAMVMSATREMLRLTTPTSVMLTIVPRCKLLIGLMFMICVLLLLI